MSALIRNRVAFLAALVAIVFSMALPAGQTAAFAADSTTDLAAGGSASMTAQAGEPSVAYRVHVQNDGWQAYVLNGQMAGTEGRSLRLEGIKVSLRGDIAKTHDVFYRVHVQNVGWMDWAKNGEMAGTEGQSLRLEGIEIKLVEKGSSPSISYRAHVQNVGWQNYVTAGKMAGTEGQSLRVEALKIKLDNGSLAGGIQYRTHVQNIGWQDWVTHDDVAAGTEGQSLRVEALEVKLTGELATAYDVYYRAHVQNYGWLDWACNGVTAGSHGMALRVEAVEIVLVEKGGEAPGPTEKPTANQLKKTLNGIDIYSGQGDKGINIAGVDADFVIVKATEGTTYINPYYRSMADATLSSGKMLGFYHFARVGDPEAQADFFVTQVGPYIGRAALFLDWEDGPYRGILLQGPGWAKRFLDRVYAKTGVRPLIYMSKSVTRSYDWSQVAPAYGLWVAQYPDYKPTGYQGAPWTDSTGFGAWAGPTIFQYTSTGRISGYNANLDLDLFYGTVEDWQDMQKKVR